MVGKTHYPRIVSRPTRSFFLLAPRGVGKSTWAREHFTDARQFDLLDESLHHSLLANPGNFAAELRTVPQKTWVIVDEVQRIPTLLNEVHRFIEERDLRFALLGSSARKLKSAGTNLLAGRAGSKTMFPLLPEELGADFDLDALLRFGSIPLVWAADDRAGALDAYVRLYLREEIRAEALVRNLPAFLRFLPIAALFHGQTINVSGVARDAGTARTTVEGYLAVLEDTLLVFRLPGYEAKLRVRERRHPKLFWIDPGLVRAMKRQVGAVGAEEVGPLLEGWVLTVLRAYAAERELFDEISYWAPVQARATEVDFLLRRQREMLAIEVKSRGHVHPDLLTGLRAISDLPGLVRRVLVYRGARPLRTEDGIDVLPIAHFARAVESGKLWP